MKEKSESAAVQTTVDQEMIKQQQYTAQEIETQPRIIFREETTPIVDQIHLQKPKETQNYSQHNFWS